MAVVGIDTDPTETPDRIRNYQAREDYHFPASITDREIIKAYQVIRQSTKVGVDRGGIVRLNQGYGTRDEGWWQEVFSSLAGS